MKVNQEYFERYRFEVLKNYFLSRENKRLGEEKLFSRD